MSKSLIVRYGGLVAKCSSVASGFGAKKANRVSGVIGIVVRICAPIHVVEKCGP